MTNPTLVKEARRQLAQLAEELDTDAHWIKLYDPARVAAALRTLLASLPTNDGGYVEAFYDLARMLGIGARASPPKEVWEKEVKPRLLAMLALPTDDDDTVERV